MVETGASKSTAMSVTTSLICTALVAGWTLLLAPAGLAGNIGPRERLIEQPSAPPFGDIEHLDAPVLRGIMPEKRIIEHQLDTTVSRGLQRSGQPVEGREVQRQLGATEQRLDSFKTQHPNAAATPMLERQLDSLNRPIRILEPGPPTLLDQR